MLTDRIEAKWIDLFAGVFALCKVAAGGGIRAPELTCLRSISLAISV